jgi:nicotinamidase-related amidase
MEARMRALIVVDAQNEFSEGGLRPVPFHDRALAYIQSRVAEARKLRSPIAWIRHYNKPDESRAFVPGSWGSELSAGFGPTFEFGPERLFEKDVFGAFYGTGLEEWLRSLGVNEVLLVGFYTHMCVSTSAREALMRGFTVFIDPDATGSHDLSDSLLGSQTADEVRRAALLHLKDMGVAFAKTELSREEIMDSRVNIPVGTVAH